jgi:ribosome-associated translation inhibitor RaiA
MDSVVDKLERQVMKYKEKHQNYQQEKSFEWMF